MVRVGQDGQSVAEARDGGEDGRDEVWETWQIIPLQLCREPFQRSPPDLRLVQSLPRQPQPLLGFIFRPFDRELVQSFHSVERGTKRGNVAREILHLLP